MKWLVPLFLNVCIIPYAADGDFKVSVSDEQRTKSGDPILLSTLLASKESIEIFKMNVTLYPDAFNTYDSLGEAYERAGDKENAIKNYCRLETWPRTSPCRF
jgi:hypothetical protein